MRAELETQLSYCRNLPTPPGVALRIIELAQDPDVVMSAAADAIGMDAALSARMLRIANSPLYASRRRVENLSQALTVLGLNATLTLALGFSLAQGLRGSGRYAAHQEKTWRRSVVSGLISRLLGQQLGLRKLEELMLAGLLQDIGVLALLQVYPEEYPPLLAQANDNAELLQLEREHLSCSHAEVGDWMAKHWNLPALLRTAIRESESAVSSAPFHACVAVSGLVADIWMNEDAEAAQQFAAQAARERLGMDEVAFAQLIEQASLMLPEVCRMFDVQIANPDRIGAILDQARELLVVRNLREIQEASRARKDADEFEHRARTLAEEVMRDPLTGVYNRNQLKHVLEKEFEAAARHARPLSIAFVDLDDFKKINDRWGHLAGDQVLRNFAQTLQKYLRGSDIVARYGGEEFLVVLPGTDEEAALKVLQRILAEVTRLPMAVIDEQALHITFSAGLATHGTVEQFVSVDQLLKAADEALYGAKREGRNRVSSSSAASG